MFENSSNKLLAGFFPEEIIEQFINDIFLEYDIANDIFISKREPDLVKGDIDFYNLKGDNLKDFIAIDYFDNDTSLFVICKFGDDKEVVLTKVFKKYCKIAYEKYGFEFNQDYEKNHKMAIARLSRWNLDNINDADAKLIRYKLWLSLNYIKDIIPKLAIILNIETKPTLEEDLNKSSVESTYFDTELISFADSLSNIIISYPKPHARRSNIVVNFRYKFKSEIDNILIEFMQKDCYSDEDIKIILQNAINNSNEIYLNMQQKLRHENK